MLLAIVTIGPGLYLFEEDVLAGAIPLFVIGVYVLSVVGFYFSVGLAAAADMIFRGQAERDGRRRPRRLPQPLQPDLRLGGDQHRDQPGDGRCSRTRAGSAARSPPAWSAWPGRWSPSSPCR